MASKRTGSSTSKDGLVDMFFLWLAKTNEQMGRIEPALGFYNSLIKSNPKSVTALTRRALIWLSRSEDDKALADAQKAVTAAGRDRNALRTRGIVQIFAGNFEGALKDFKKALEGGEWDSLTCLYVFMMLTKLTTQMESAEFLNEAVDKKIKSLDWPLPILKYWRGTMSITDLMAFTSSDKVRLMDCRGYLGFCRALSRYPQEGKPDLQFVFDSHAGSLLIQVIAGRGLEMLRAEQTNSYTSSQDKANRSANMDWVG